MNATTRILFVEDVPDDAELALLEIRKSGLAFESLRVDRKDAFLNALADFRPDIVVSDYNMPSFDGMDALTIVRAKSPDLPFIILTGAINEMTAVACLKAGANDYILKDYLYRLPFAIDECLAKLKDQREKEDSRRLLKETEGHYRELFEHSVVPTIVEDFSGIAVFFDSLRAEGVKDFRRHFANHPESVRHCASLIRILDMNQKFSQFFKAAGKDAFLGSPGISFSESSWPAFADELVALAEGLDSFEADFPALTLDGEEKTISLFLSVDPQHRKTLSRILVSFVDVTAQKIAEEKIRTQVEHLKALREIDMVISSSFDLKLNLGIALGQVKTQMQVDVVEVFLYKPALKVLELFVSLGLNAPVMKKTRLRLGEGYAGIAAQERESVLIPDLSLRDDNHFREENSGRGNFIWYIAVPLITKGQVVGVLQLFRRSTFEPGDEWFEFLDALAGQCAIAIDNATLFESLQKSNTELVSAYDATIEGWSHALDLRDKETEGHTLRVTETTVRLAQLFDLSEAELTQVRRGALLHDIGKLGVPDAILLKPGPLTDEEWAIMKKHPVYAWEMISPIRFLRPAIDIPYCHHEKWDGTGYPRGLKGEEIPLTARIFAVVDVWDALRSDRPYRAAWPSEKVIAHIASLSGKQFDPKVLRICLESGLLEPEPIDRLSLSN